MPSTLLPLDGLGSGKLWLDVGSVGLLVSPVLPIAPEVLEELVLPTSDAPEEAPVG